MTEKGKTVEIASEKSHSGCVVPITEEWQRAYAEANFPGAEVVGPLQIDWSGPEPVYVTVPFDAEWLVPVKDWAP